MNRWYEVKNVALAPDFTDDELKFAAARALGVGIGDVTDIALTKKSVDARRKPFVKLIVSAAVRCGSEPRGAAEYSPPKRSLKDFVGEPDVQSGKTVAVIGSGPAGLFAALTLCECGIKPIIIERGSEVEERLRKVETFDKFGILDPDCNVQFGEGGAGTFSDGKLNTGTGSEFISAVFGEFVKYGAPEEILYDAKPHIGTDRLKTVVKNIREAIEKRGGAYYFDTVFRNAKTRGKGLTLTLEGKHGGSLDADAVILAIGHSSRDTFGRLYSDGLAMERKPFAVGVRIEHEQKFINKAMYGAECVAGLGAADYKLASKTEDGRGCFTFCMCPGGTLSAAASESGGIVTNGMSVYKRDGQNANSALLVGVRPEDFGAGDGALAGVEFQRRYESIAFALAGGNFKAPAQNASDFLTDRLSKSWAVEPTYPPGVTSAALKDCLPDYVSQGLKQGLTEFDKKIKGFASEGLLTGPETRSSSPVRLLRDENGESSIKGLFPCGEGAGYAGGITSAAADGIKTALKVLKSLF